MHKAGAPPRGEASTLPPAPGAARTQNGDIAMNLCTCLSIDARHFAI